MERFINVSWTVLLEHQSACGQKTAGDEEGCRPCRTAAARGAPWSIESSTDAIRKPAGRGRFSPCRSRRWHLLSGSGAGLGSA